MTLCQHEAACAEVAKTIKNPYAEDWIFIHPNYRDWRLDPQSIVVQCSKGPISFRGDPTVDLEPHQSKSTQPKSPVRMEINGADPFLIFLFSAAACTTSPWWGLGVLSIMVSWFWAPRWSKAEGWRFWR